ncbi:RNI-like superfamily protein [Artemisia annua]|uniref:RNI-like superfamily protein n=1 Tax=Artemisia annua TaxID=35608 RepID=A0A2U1LUQ4_ARTAN|nr:RNI-like superfamily protein [Artemisia annua]
MEKKVDRILYHSGRYALVLEELGKIHNINMGEYSLPSVSEQCHEILNNSVVHLDYHHHRVVLIIATYVASLYLGRQFVAGKCELDSSAVPAILSGGGLEYLNLSFRWKDELGAVGLGGFGANIKVLEIIVTITNDAIMNIVKGCPLLQEWNLSNCYMIINVSGWESHEIRDMMRKDVKIIEYEEESKNTISWDSGDFTI